MTGFHLAQVNISRLLAPIDSDLLADFVAALEPVNAAADSAPGFVWRLQTEDGDATAIRVFDDLELIVNLTVWTDLRSLGDFVFGMDHAAIMRGRRKWFARPTQAMTALWWQPAGTVPTTADAEHRLELLRRLGPTPDAFTLRTPFPPPGAPLIDVVPDDRTCTV
jgi:uncharacterized protein DUF3291